MNKQKNYILIARTNQTFLKKFKFFHENKKFFLTKKIDNKNIFFLAEEDFCLV